MLRKKILIAGAAGMLGRCLMSRWRDAYDLTGVARHLDAGLLPCEAYDLFRHDVAKLVEPGEPWPRHGSPRPAGEVDPWRDPERAGRVASRARDLVLARMLGRPERTGPLPRDLDRKSVV